MACLPHDTDMNLSFQDDSPLEPTNTPIWILGVDISGWLYLYEHICCKFAEVELAASQLHVTMHEAGPAPAPGASQDCQGPPLERSSSRACEIENHLKNAPI